MSGTQYLKRGMNDPKAQARRRKEMLQKGNTREQELNYIQVQKQILREHSGEAADEEERPKKKKMSLDDMVSKYEKKMSGEGEDEEPEPPPKPKKKLNLDALVANFEKKEEPPARASYPGQTGVRHSYNNSSEWNNAKQRMEDKATKGEKQRMEEFIQAKIQGQGDAASSGERRDNGKEKKRPDDDKDKDAKLAEALADVAALKARLAASESASSSANRPAGDPSDRLAQLISETHGRMQVITGEKPRAEIWPEMSEASIEQAAQEQQAEEEPSADNMSAEIRRRLALDGASEAKEKAHEDMAEEIKRRLEAHIRGHQDGGAPQVEERPPESEADVKKRLLQKRADKLKRNEKASTFARAPLEMPEEMRTRLLQERETKAKLLQERAQAIKAKGPPAMPSDIQRRMEEQQQMQEMAESQAQWEIPQDRGLSLALPAGTQIAQSKAAGGCPPAGAAPYGNLKRKLSDLSEGNQGPELSQLAQGMPLGSRPQSFAELAQLQSGEFPPDGNFGGSSGYETAPGGLGGGLGGFDGSFDGGFGGLEDELPGMSSIESLMVSMHDAPPPVSVPQFSMPPPLSSAPAVKKRKTPQEIIESMNKRIEAISYQTAAEEEEAAQEDANAAQLMGVTQQPAQPDLSEMAAQMAGMDPAMAAQMAAMEAQFSLMDPAMQAQLAALDPAMQAQLAAQMAAQSAVQTQADGHTFGADAFGLMFGAEGCADTSNFMQDPSMAGFPVAPPRTSEEVWKPKTQVNIYQKGGSKGGGSWNSKGAGSWQEKGAWQDTNKWNNKEEWKDSGWNEPGKWKDPKKKEDDWGTGKSWGSTDTWDPEDVWEGDWICPKCKILVFGWKDACGMCQTSKADGRPPEEFFPGIKINKRPAEDAPEEEEEFKPKAAKNSAGWAKLAMAMAQNLTAPEP